MLNPHIMRVDSQTLHGVPFHVPRVASAPFQIPRVNSYAKPRGPHLPDGLGAPRVQQHGADLSAASAPGPTTASRDLKRWAAEQMRPPWQPMDAMHQEHRSLSPQQSPRPFPKAASWEMNYGMAPSQPVRGSQSPHVERRFSLPAQLSHGPPPWAQAPSTHQQTSSPRPSSRRPSPTPSAAASPRPLGRLSPTPSAAASPRPFGRLSPTPSAAASPRPCSRGSPRPSAAASSPRPHSTGMLTPPRQQMQSPTTGHVDVPADIPLPMGLLAAKHPSRQNSYNPPRSPLLDLPPAGYNLVRSYPQTSEDLPPAGYNHARRDDSRHRSQAFDQIGSSPVSGVELQPGPSLPATARNGSQDNSFLSTQMIQSEFKTPRFARQNTSGSSEELGLQMVTPESNCLTISSDNRNADVPVQFWDDAGADPAPADLSFTQPNGLTPQSSDPVLILPNLPPAGSSDSRGPQPVDVQRASSAPPASWSSPRDDTHQAWQAIYDTRGDADRVIVAPVASDYSSGSQGPPGKNLELACETIPASVAAMPSSGSPHVVRSFSQQARSSVQPVDVKVSVVAPPSLTSSTRAPRPRETLPPWRPGAASLGTGSNMGSRSSLLGRKPRPPKASEAKPKSRPRRRRDYSNMTVVDLKLEIKKRGLDCVFCFNRDDLVERLRESDRDEDA